MSAPATPQPRTLQAAISTPSPGSWQHPRSDEIARRTKANTFDQSNLRKIIWNGGALAALLYALSQYVHSSVPTTKMTSKPELTGQNNNSPWTHILTRTLQPITTPLVLLITLLGLYNILTALSPLIKTPDEMTDIPLTPTQRSLLGLDPTATPPPSTTPGTQQYITPPRYPRSPTPRNISPLATTSRSSGSTYGTPITKSPSFGRESSNSPGANLAASPLRQKSLGKSEAMRRSSYGSPSPLGPGGGVLGTPGTPSPTNGRGASVALNNKWLYQKGRSASGTGFNRYPSMYTGNTLVDY